MSANRSTKTHYSKPQIDWVRFFIALFSVGALTVNWYSRKLQRRTR
ncbi:hypothetical protein LFAB_04170 [Lactiplantibacillus fabifermentans T30PCM01]|uniref:Uncharacterized protein n=1 Tax=Lactiplantibacillus fabifermentans T30PCM01 TaxID=1400520 RepID=W6TAN5_9LACO|nr:hypothetical protein LFAB_04170 [Lactiplantibacillus fabifermentans T30PCM01]